MPSRSLPRSRFAIRLRVLSLRVMTTRPLTGLAKKMCFGQADAIDLPGYAVTHGVGSPGRATT